ncbi:Hypothetical protein LUCI_4611 [Lucifera butyrica]|uniref:Trimeric lpxa-like n=1 Tax=Lucifera butyrica TaxID=1351585 RepID=A0A498RD01_9FIRM|nr:acyltransferase [Lucifera butyrica]VBB09321.1 Hypothetical protein LUCI_4611 [Lucifera butyrica]
MFKSILRNPRRIFSYFYSYWLSTFYVAEKNCPLPILIKSPGLPVKVRKKRDAKIIVSGQLILDSRSSPNPKSNIIIELGYNAILEVKGTVILHQGTVITVNDNAKVVLGTDISKTIEAAYNFKIVADEYVQIGSGGIISWDVFITDSSAHKIGNPPSIKNAPVIINEDVWISLNATILKGVEIGRGAVIGARAVVVKDVPPGSIAAGNPAKVVSRDIYWQL